VRESAQGFGTSNLWSASVSHIDQQYTLAVRSEPSKGPLDALLLACAKSCRGYWASVFNPPQQWHSGTPSCQVCYKSHTADLLHSRAGGTGEPC
jgi:hypothetical protein